MKYGLPSRISWYEPSPFLTTWTLTAPPFDGGCSTGGLTGCSTGGLAGGWASGVFVTAAGSVRGVFSPQPNAPTIATARPHARTNTNRFNCMVAPFAERTL